jgi:hypothetical protein
VTAITTRLPTLGEQSMNNLSLSESLRAIHAAFGTFLMLEDPALIDIALAVRIAHEFEDAEAVALLVVGPSSSAKTEIVVPLAASKKGYLVSELTPQTLVSGLSRRGGNQSLVHQLKDNVLVVKDLTTIMSGRPDERTKVLAQLREILDGSIAATYGNGQRVNWQGKISVIGAVTNVIDAHHSVNAALGTRWLYLRIPNPNPQAVADAALSLGTRSKRDRNSAAAAVARFVDQFEQVPLESVSITDGQRAEIGRWAQFLAVARTPVVRDRNHRDITDLPSPESPARVAKQLLLVACAHARIHGRDCLDETDILIVARLTWDSIPQLRRRILEVIAKHPGCNDLAIKAFCPMMAATIGRCTQDLEALQLVSSRLQPPAKGLHYYPEGVPNPLPDPQNHIE